MDRGDAASGAGRGPAPHHNVTGVGDSDQRAARAPASLLSSATASGRACRPSPFKPSSPSAPPALAFQAFVARGLVQRRPAALVLHSDLRTFFEQLIDDRNRSSLG